VRAVLVDSNVLIDVTGEPTLEIIAPTP